MAQLGTVPPPRSRSCAVDSSTGMGTAGKLIGSFESTEGLLAEDLAGRAGRQIMEEIRGPAGRTMWDKLGNVNEAVLANYLKNEYPQTVAVVLSKIRADHAARVLALLPEGFAMEVVHAHAAHGDRAERGPRRRRAHPAHRVHVEPGAARRRDSHEMMAEIFNNLDRETESRFIAALEERNRESAERIQA